MFQVSLCPSSGEQTACHCLRFLVLAMVVVVLESWVVRCVHCAEDVRQHPLHSVHISLPDSLEPQQPKPGQETIGSGTQSALLMMGVKMPETC